jgi:hypothetical protein
VLKLHKRKLSLRDIADETNLSLSTVRTIIGRESRTDRTTIRRLGKIDPMNTAVIEAKARKKTRDALPKQITKMGNDIADLKKAVKGLGKK